MRRRGPMTRHETEAHVARVQATTAERYRRSREARDRGDAREAIKDQQAAAFVSACGRAMLAIGAAG